MVAEKFEIAENKYEFFEFIRKLRNNREVNKGFVERDEISLVSHLEYMKKYGKNYFICLKNKTPVGYVGVIEGDIRVAVSPEFQGSGAGTFMIKKIIEKNPNSFAKIKVENNKSISLFKKCNFKIKYYILEIDGE